MSESGSGEPDSASTATDKDFSCPSCGKCFDSEQYMKVHHAAAHGESIAGKLIECDWCEDEFRRNPSDVGDTNYCSNECMGHARSVEYSGESHPNYSGGKATISCEWCGEDYCVWPAKAESSRFCSMDCKSEWQSENVSGEGHHQYNSVKVDCHICGETVVRKPSHLEKQENVYCSYTCHREYQSRHQVGENHHMYGGGRAETYGPNWDEQAEKCRVRDDYTCQLCGLHQDDHWRKLTAHHLIPRKQFMDSDGNYDWERGNRLENLLTVCTSCHQKWEGIPLRPQYKPNA